MQSTADFNGVPLSDQVSKLFVNKIEVTRWPRWFKINTTKAWSYPICSPILRKQNSQCLSLRLYAIVWMIMRYQLVRSRCDPFQIFYSSKHSWPLKYTFSDPATLNDKSWSTLTPSSLYEKLTRSNWIAPLLGHDSGGRLSDAVSADFSWSKLAYSRTRSVFVICLTCLW